MLRVQQRDDVAGLGNALGAARNENIGDDYADGCLFLGLRQGAMGWI